MRSPTVRDSHLVNGMIKTGSCWYPRRSAEDKLRYYASQFSLVEHDSTYYAFPIANGI